MKRIIIAALTCVFTASATLACDPSVCAVTVAGGSPLDVHGAPDGAIVATLAAGTEVEVVERRQVGNRSWLRVAYFGADSGYVFGEQLTCEDTEDGRICVAAGLPAHPLEVRDSPDGKVLGTWENGMRVRPYDEVTREGKLWLAVERFADDNALGWVPASALDCVDDH